MQRRGIGGVGPLAHQLPDVLCQSAVTVYGDICTTPHFEAHRVAGTASLEASLSGSSIPFRRFQYWFNREVVLDELLKLNANGLDRIRNKG